MSDKDLIEVKTISDPYYVASYFVRLLRAYECDDDTSTDHSLRMDLYSYFRRIRDYPNSPFVTEYFDHDDNFGEGLGRSQMLLIYPWGAWEFYFVQYGVIDNPSAVGEKIYVGARFASGCDLLSGEKRDDLIHCIELWLADRMRCPTGIAERKSSTTPDISVDDSGKKIISAGDALKVLGLKQTQRQTLTNWAKKAGKQKAKRGYWYLDDIKFLKREYAPTLDRDV